MNSPGLNMLIGVWIVVGMVACFSMGALVTHMLSH